MATIERIPYTSDTALIGAKPVYFQSAQHQECFISLIKDRQKLDGDVLLSEYAALYYLLTSDALYGKRAANYLTEDGVNVGKLLHQPASSGERTLLHLGYNLFTWNTTYEDEDGEKQPLCCYPEQFTGLGESWFWLAMQAIELRYYRHRLVL